MDSYKQLEGIISILVVIAFMGALAGLFEHGYGILAVIIAIITWLLISGYFKDKEKADKRTYDLKLFTQIINTFTYEEKMASIIILKNMLIIPKYNNLAYSNHFLNNVIKRFGIDRISVDDFYKKNENDLKKVLSPILLKMDQNQNKINFLISLSLDMVKPSGDECDKMINVFKNLSHIDNHKFIKGIKNSHSFSDLIENT